jgi:hypothetical protein
MLTLNPKIPAWIEAEAKHLVVLTATHNVEKLRERRRPHGINVDIYHHSEGTDSYFCDVRRRYFRWAEVIEEASIKIACGQYLYTSVIEYQKNIHFIVSYCDPDPNLN